MPRVEKLGNGRSLGSTIMARLNRECDILVNKVAGEILLVRKIQTRRTKIIK